MTHSPLPWTYHNVNGVKDWIEDAHGSIQIENIGRIDGPLIVRAVNAHDALVAALKEILSDDYCAQRLAELRIDILSPLKLARGEA